MTTKTMPRLVEINRSEDGLEGLVCNVIEMDCDEIETDYRIQLPSGEELWIPSENVTIIC
ncbi:hypothetical protein ACQCN2_01010 [Brevibacillus ginsengisoli]|uniref:hypothetical protein n=1 Tax=Brevibacillus ginsengisoli TaxID=363854 RepID=UPI003CED3DC9